MAIFFIYFKGLLIKLALGKKKRFLFIKHCLPIVDETPPGSEIQQMHWAYCRLDTVSFGRCSALMMQKIKPMLFLCSIKRKAIKTVVK